MDFQGVLLNWKTLFPGTIAHISQQSTDQQIEGCQELHTIVLEKPRGIMLFLNNSYFSGKRKYSTSFGVGISRRAETSFSSLQISCGRMWLKKSAEVLWGEGKRIFPFSFSAEELRASVCAQLCVCVSSMPVLTSDLTIMRTKKKAYPYTTAYLCS